MTTRDRANASLTLWYCVGVHGSRGYYHLALKKRGFFEVWCFVATFLTFSKFFTPCELHLNIETNIFPLSLAGGEITALPAGSLFWELPNDAHTKRIMKSIHVWIPRILNGLLAHLNR